MWDWILLGATLALTPGALRTLFDRSAYIPRATSGLFTVAIAIIAVTLTQMDAPLGATANAIGSCTWAAIFVARGKRPSNG